MIPTAVGDYFKDSILPTVILVILIGVFSGGALLPLFLKAILFLIGFGPIGPIAGKSLIVASQHV